MRSLKIVVVRDLCKSLGDGGPTADPRVMEAVDSHFEGVQSLFEEVSVDVVQMIARVQSKDGSQIAVAIDEKLGV